MLIGFANGYEIPILIGIVALMFGSSQIPKFAKNLGRAQKEFKDGITEGQREASESSEAKVPDTSNGDSDS